MAFTDITENLATPKSLPEEDRMNDVGIESITEDYLKELEATAQNYVANRLADEAQGQKPGESINYEKQCIAMRKFVSLLNKKGLLLHFSKGRYSITIPSTNKEAAAPYSMKLQGIMNVVYGKTDPLSLQNSDFDFTQQPDTSTSYNTNESIINTHIARACVEHLAFTLPESSVIDNDFSKLNLNDDVRQGRKELTIDMIYAAIPAHTRDIKQIQFREAYQGIAQDGTIINKGKTDKNISEIEKIQNMRRSILQLGLDEIQEQLAVSKDTQTSVTGLAKNIAQSMGIDTGNMSTVGDLFTFEGSGRAALNTWEGAGQLSKNAIKNFSYDWKQPFDHPGNWLFGASFLLGLLPKSWTFGLKNYLLTAGIGGLLSRYATGKNIWEVFDTSMKKSADYLTAENPNAPLTTAQQRLKNKVLNEDELTLWTKEFGEQSKHYIAPHPEEQARLLAIQCSMPMENVFRNISFDEEKHDIVFSPNMLTEDQQALFKKYPNLDLEKNFRFLLKQLYKAKKTHIETFEELHLSSGDGIGQYSEEYIAMKYLHLRYNHTFRKNQDPVKNELELYDSTTMLKDIITYDLQPDEKVENKFLEFYHDQKLKNATKKVDALAKKTSSTS